MGTQAQKKKLFDGLQPKQAKKKLLEIWAGVSPEQMPFNRAAKQFAKAHTMSLLGLCETWHRLRSQNYAVEVMIQSFAQTVAHKNKENHSFTETIHKQRKRLSELEKFVSDHGGLAGVALLGTREAETQEPASPQTPAEKGKP